MIGAEPLKISSTIKPAKISIVPKHRADQSPGQAWEKKPSTSSPKPAAPMTAKPAVSHLACGGSGPAHDVEGKYPHRAEALRDRESFFSSSDVRRAGGQLLSFEQMRPGRNDKRHRHAQDRQKNRRG